MSVYAHCQAKVNLVAYITIGLSGYNKEFLATKCATFYGRIPTQNCVVLIIFVVILLLIHRFLLLGIVVLTTKSELFCFQLGTANYKNNNSLLFY